MTMSRPSNDTAFTERFNPELELGEPRQIRNVAYILKSKNDREKRNYNGGPARRPRHPRPLSHPHPHRIYVPLPRYDLTKVFDHAHKPRINLGPNGGFRYVLAAPRRCLISLSIAPATVQWLMFS